jgi:hypothetical protein
MIQSLSSTRRNKDKDVFPIHYMEPKSTQDFVMRKPKTVWQKRKEKIVEAWVLFKESRVGLIGIGILILFMLMALVSHVLL